MSFLSYIKLSKIELLLNQGSPDYNSLNIENKFDFSGVL